MVKRPLSTICIFFALSAAAAAASPTAINPRDYGVTFSGVDDTAGWRATIAAAMDEGLPIAAPCGTSLVTGRLTITGPITFAGGGMDCTILKFPTPNAYLFIVTSPQAVTFRDFSIYCAGASLVQYGISFYVPAPNRNFGSVISHVRLADCEASLDLYTNSQFVVDGVIITASWASFGIRVADVNWPDYGDGVIINSTLINGAQSGEAILQYSGGGLKVMNNKIYGFYFGYLLSLQGAT